jgi:hypothetical protein
MSKFFPPRKMRWSPIFGLAIHGNDRVHVTASNTQQGGLTLPTIVGSERINYGIQSLPLLDEKHLVSIAGINHDDTKIFDFHNQLFTFCITNIGRIIIEKYGIITLNAQWQVSSGASD